MAHTTEFHCGICRIKLNMELKHEQLGTCAMIDVRMDFESYYNADSDGKIQLIEEMLIKAIKR